MKKYLVLVLALLCGLTASGCSFETEGVNGGFIRETYTGIIEEQFTENGNEYIRVDTENNEVIDFLLTDTTEINGDENISVGDSVEIDCVHRYETSTYEILKVTVTTVQENIQSESEQGYTYEELSEMSGEELLDLFIQNGLVINDNLKASFTDEELQSLFKEHFEMWHTGMSAMSHTMYLDLAEQTKAIFDKIMGETDITDTIDFDASISWAGWSNDPKIRELALNKDTFELSSARHIPVYKCDTLEELNEFKTTFSGTFTMDGTWDEVASFEKVTADYTEDFFIENTLLLAYVEAGSSTPRFGVDSVSKENGTLSVYVKCTYNPEEGDSAMAGWLFTIPVNNDQIQDCTNFDAVVVFEQPPALTVVSDETSVAALLGTYSWQQKNIDGTFTDVRADSPHPLDCGDLLSPPLETAEATATLRFTHDPDKIVGIQCWSDSYWDIPSSGGEDVIFNENTIELKSGGYIYEVVAQWDDDNGYGGTAHYSFYITVE